MTTSFKPIFYTLSIIIFLGCNGKKELSPVIQPAGILQSSDQISKYIMQYVNFDSDFSAFDTQGKSMDKQTFLNEVLSGSYLPLRLKTQTGENSYQLHKINVLIEDSPKYYLIDQARQGLFQLSLVGKPAPKFEFVDLAGHKYNNQNTRGKILVMKFWFIGCVACVQEMPEVNKIVDRYQDRKDILFVSLASNKVEPLKKFLKQVTFKYQTVADADHYMIDSIGTKVFPSHLIIGRDGKIRKFTLQYTEVEELLKTL
ncbi:TlpA family protein disulfide reductase [Pedobacter riviphilus]|uniref:TlpA family protein disulfide reductase n=1 Tax=Pedobacter riviphilus TaxID=2766984 RepID=A0ABX6TD04_9SPHI|nr:TlpA disulfide reductase family protein [Pedobacter riviphilus]QNR82873.1 TlpA family protein disulfide reductase [Pedobacter riviphilus]